MAAQEALSIEQVLDLWLTVPRLPIAPRERRVLERGVNFILPFESKWRPRGTFNLAITTWGEADRPLVQLMHGWGGHRGQLTPFVEPLLGAGFRVAAFDAPAHGDTAGQQASGYQMAAALRTVTDKVGKPLAVVAHSFGATALGIAMQDWLSLGKVVIIGATRRLEDTIKPFFKLNSLPESIEPELRALTERIWGGSNVWERTALDLALPKFDTPALVIHDRDDETTPYVSGAAVARAWRSAKMVTTRGLGHRGVLKDQAVITQVVGFIAGQQN